jgi:hypothetical protein
MDQRLRDTHNVGVHPAHSSGSDPDAQSPTAYRWRKDDKASKWHAFA